jgi:hypothetical protein
MTMSGVRILKNFPIWCITVLMNLPKQLKLKPCSIQAGIQNYGKTGKNDLIHCIYKL